MDRPNIVRCVLQHHPAFCPSLQHLTPFPLHALPPAVPALGPLLPRAAAAHAVSSANPWLDFLPDTTAHQLAGELNHDLEDYCATGPAHAHIPGLKRLYGFGLLTLVPGATADALVSTVEQVAALPHLCGVIVGTRGIGKALDDPALEPVWAALADAGPVVLLQPHYGVDKLAWGERENGHVLPLATLKLQV